MTSEDTNPGADLSNWLTPPFSRWAFRHVDEVLATAAVRAGADRPMPLPEAPPSFDEFRMDRQGSPLTLGEAFAATAGDALVVLKDGQVVQEVYAEGMGPHTRHIVMSSTKAVTGLLLGAMAGRGMIEVDAQVAQYVPEVAATAYAGATLRHLIDMRTGVVMDGPTQAAYSAAAGWDAPVQGGPDLHDFFATLEAENKGHGGPFAYVSANTDLLGWAMERAAGKPYAELLSEYLWPPLGAEDDALITTDRAGAARAAGGFCCTVRDFARLGQLAVDGGTRNGVEIIPRAWVDDLATGGDPTAWAEGEWGHVFRFAGQHVRNRSGWYAIDDAPSLLFAMGIHGQNLFVDTANRIVIAKLSSQPGPFDYMTVIQQHALARAIQAYLI